MNVSEKVSDTQDVDPLLLEHALNRFGAQCEAKWLVDHGERNYTSQFLEHGYHVMPMPQEIADTLKCIFVEENADGISPQSCAEGYLSSALDEKGCEELNRQNTFYGEPAKPIVNALDSYFDSIKEEVECQLGHGWEVSNVRAWAVQPHADYGSNTWHADGFSRYVRKLLLFVNPPGLEAGTIEIATRKGRIFHVEASTPVCVLFDNAVLTHRGRPPKSTSRPIIEVTIAPAEKSRPKSVFAGQVARVPLSLAVKTASELSKMRYVPEGRKPFRIPTVRQVRKKLPGKITGMAKKIKRNLHSTKAGRDLPAVTNLMGRLNIGGGRRWQHKGWINLEGAPGPANPFPFWFTGESVFPVPSSSIQLVYSSHCLEHLDDATVTQALKEARRVLSGDGKLVLKLPDCDEALEKWREGDDRYFRQTIRLEKVDMTWASRGVEDTIDNRAAYIFCGFWNQAFGHNFIGKYNRRSWDREAYNGPPLQAAAMAEELKALDSPHDIALRLRQTVIDNEEDYTFNHQNGWGRAELKVLLKECGFEVTSFDTKEIIRTNGDVPGIQLMEDMSVYCEAVPV